MKAIILTPVGPVFEGEVAGVQMPGVIGGFEVRNGHAPLVSLLDVGKLVVKRQDDENLLYAISGGFTEVNDNVATVMVEEAIAPDQIDITKEKERKAQVEKALKSLKIETPEHASAEKALRVIKNRIQIAGN